MTMNYKTTERVKALALQCLFASVAQPVGPTVGEVVKFIIKHGALTVSEYQVKRILMGLCNTAHVQPVSKSHGKRVMTHYYITSSGTYLLLANVSFLPKHISKYMNDLAFRVSAGAESLINDYHSQGVSRG